MRGGVSWSISTRTEEEKYSPHAWGCFLHILAQFFKLRVFPTCVGVFRIQINHIKAEGVFPTCVGVFPCSAPVYLDGKGIPHMRGGVSGPFNWSSYIAGVFPTCVGVFL